MTPVDIDKLKELLAKATLWKRRIASYTQDERAAQRSADEALQRYDTYLPALIAKAERVDALTEALSVGETMLNKCMSAWSCGEPEHRVRAMLDAADAFRAKLNDPGVIAARNALSPKESE